MNTLAAGVLLAVVLVAANGEAVDGRAPTPDSGGSYLDRCMAAIGSKESNGRYDAHNSGSGAQGKYQIMPKYWPGWAAEAGLSRSAPRTPANQERVARHKIGAYIDAFGDCRSAAIAWYSGPDTVTNPKKKGSYRSKRQRGGPSINDYADDVVRRMKGTN